MLVSVILLDAMDWLVVESAMDTRADSLKDGMSSESPAPAATSERSDGRERMGERDGRIGGTSSRSLVPVGVSPPSGSVPNAVPASLDEEARSGLSDRNVGRPADGGVQRLVLFRAGDRGEYDDEDTVKFGEDMTAREEEPVRYGEPRVTFAVVLATAASTGLDLLPPRKTWERVGTGGVSAHLTKAMIVFATRARQSEVPSMRSSLRKSSSGGRPLAEQDARNLVTFDMRSLPSSRGSIRVMDPGRNLFISLMNFHEGVSVPLRERGNQGEKRRDLQAKNIAVSQRFCEQPALPLFSCGTSTCTDLGRAPVGRSPAFLPHALQSGESSHAHLHFFRLAYTETDALPWSQHFLAKHRSGHTHRFAMHGV